MTLSKHQFGFRPGHSTSHALINFVDKVANALWCAYTRPPLFHSHINDLPACSNELEFILFADDTSIFFEHSDLDVPPILTTSSTMFQLG